MIVEAEQLKANLIAPKGTLPIEIDENIEMLRKLDNDDDFFYVNCHIDGTLRAKIEKGEFVDLDKLLPKDKAAYGYQMNEENRMGIFFQDGETYYAPVKKESAINSIKKWDTAFRIYASIYTAANPNRSSEIWQYVHVIHTIANTYNWDSVSFYDFTFRRLMAEKPWRSWAKTYTQGWNLALNSGSVKKSFNDYSFKPDNGKLQGKIGNKSQNHDWRDDCCWRYNKGKMSEK